MFKNRRLRFTSLLMVVVAVFSLSAVDAQDASNEQPLLKMLASVPDNVTSRTELYFNDRKAVEVAYPPAKMPADWTEFQAFNADKGKTDSFKPIHLWWKVWMNQQSSLMSRYMRLSDEMEKTVGFDFFTVEQELNYGQPPEQALQLSGKFDLGKVRVALTAQGYTQQDQAGVEVWCGPDGCDSGAKQNLANRDPSNPFGGDLGRKWPIIIRDNTLIGSPDATIIQNHVAVNAGNSKSLADAPEYQAAVAALAQNGALMQAYFWGGELLDSMSQIDPIIVTVAADKRKAVLEAMLKDYEELPVYKLLAFGDSATDTQMIAETVLIYDNEADAKIAAEILPKRIANYTSLVTRRSMTEMLADRGVTEPKVHVVNSNGQYAVLVSFPAAKTSIDDILAFTTAEEGGRVDIIPPGLTYRLLVGAAMQRDLGWLGTIPRATLEALAK